MTRYLLFPPPSDPKGSQRQATNDKRARKKERKNIPSMMPPRHVETTLTTPNLFHFQSMLTLRFPLCQPDLFEKHIRRIKHTRSISSICTFVAAEFCQLAGLDLRWFSFGGVVLSEEIAAELCGCIVGFAEVCGYLFAYFVAAVVDFYAVGFFACLVGVMY
jgi:hypothetical protein